jgi:hypothetical protein
MITNMLGKFWGNDTLIQLRDNLPQGFNLKLYNLVHKCVQNQDITFRERFANSFTITYGDQFEIVALDTNIDISYASERLEKFVNKHNPKTPQPTNIDEVRKNTLDAVKNLLKINNDIIFYDEQKMSFELNLYTKSERKRILALLATVDEFVPEVFVDITLNNSTVEELTALNDRLLEVEVLN